MTTVTSTARAKAATIRVTLEARGVSGLDDDARNASGAVAQWLDTHPNPATAHRAALLAACDGGHDTAESTLYQALIDDAAHVAWRAATEGWARPEDCWVTVDIEETQA
jgi:hypothetical protein